MFTLKVQNLSPTLQPNSYWYEHFSYGGVSWFVDMETTTNPLVPTFNYGFFAVDPDTGLNTQNVVGLADAGTFSPDGTIAITLSNDKLDPDGDGPKTPPVAGSLVSGIHGETRNLVGVLLVLADSTSGGGYTLSGNDFCAPNTPPTAALSAMPATGSAPLDVAFNSSASSDPDAGDSVVSYTFHFGDGSTPVTQSGPTISHTYTDPGTYHATLTVKDSRGQESTNVASVDIQVTGPPDLKVTNITTSGNQAREGEKVTVTATVKNDGGAGAGPSSTEFRLDNTTILGRVSTPALGAGGSANVSIQWDTRGIKGNHTLYATADVALAVTESNEDNNTSSLTVTVQGNKVKNGSFEQSNSSGSGPDGWSGSSTGAGNASWSDGGGDGSKSAATSGNGGNAATSGSPSWMSDPIAVAPGEVLTLTVSVQSLDASSAASAGLVYLGAAGNVFSIVNLITAPLTSTAFTKLEQTVTIPAGVAQLRVKFVGFAPTDLRTAGTVRFDEVGLFGN